MALLSRVSFYINGPKSHLRNDPAFFGRRGSGTPRPLAHFYLFNPLLTRPICSDEKSSGVGRAGRDSIPMHSLPALSGYITRLGVLTGKFSFFTERGNARRFEAVPESGPAGWYRWSDFHEPRSPEAVARARARVSALAPGRVAWFQRASAVRDGGRPETDPFNVFVGLSGELYVTPVKVRVLRRAQVVIVEPPAWAPEGVELWGRDVFGGYWGGPARNFAPDRAANSPAAPPSCPADASDEPARVTAAETAPQ